MARIVDYDAILCTAAEMNLRSAYPNSGAFTFPPDEPVHVVAWIGPPDPTVRTDRGFTLVPTPPPYPAALAARLGRQWDRFGGELWVLPKAHWSFELDHGHGEWLGPALRGCGVDPETLRPRTDGSAVAFEAGDTAALGLVETLLGHLRASDFAVLFPPRRHLVTVHHHQQLWWQTTDDVLVGEIGRSE